ncbi:uncharacterized protein EDB93DRAFT_284724 [Suillus bovinus]|uniref:uncharacterized protein n=1 Tax=Suillus bovinus TaxID=48563 RepID=UPI001B86E113|nr:uncharacterized protein EDB93DRAFT_284724 [Suillus bovinus]KAG2159383.1 hypothetical protein EDB93DRAFT_284724 [Suillus bovinus]
MIQKYDIDMVRLQLRLWSHHVNMCCQIINVDLIMHIITLATCELAIQVLHHTCRTARIAWVTASEKIVSKSCRSLSFKRSSKHLITITSCWLMANYCYNLRGKLSIRILGPDMVNYYSGDRMKSKKDSRVEALMNRERNCQYFQTWYVGRSRELDLGDWGITLLFVGSKNLRAHWLRLKHQVHSTPRDHANVDKHKPSAERKSE